MRIYLIAAVLALLALSVTACSHGNQIKLNSASAVPAASGSAKVGTDNNGNTTLAIQVNNLAPPGNLTPPATAYVVWIQPAGEPAQNAGIMKVEGDKLKGTFSTTTPFKNFELLITAEGDPRASTPSGMVVMRQQVSR